MQYASAIRRLYSLETLDTRFIIPSKASPKQALSDQSPQGSSDIAKTAGPSLWKTPEFILYYVIFILVVPLMVKQPVDVSRCTCRSSGV